MSSFHYFLLSIIILFSVAIIVSNNPIFSVIFLIFTFCGASIILALFNVDFLSSLFIIIYVGAISILFLFVIMMLNIKVYSFKKSSLAFFVPILNIISFLLFNEFCVMFKEIFSNHIIDYNHINLDYETISATTVYGQTLYNYFLVCILFAGVILLISMIGAISLTLVFKNKTPNEINFKQLTKHNSVILW
jgi:NADH-quinone oxidoreductase subunit J